jgi:hypothetical protein
MFPAVHGVLASQAAAANWWDDLTDVVAVYQPIGAASLAASYVNLVNPGTFDAAPGVAPTHSAAAGWTFNGTTQYLTTGVVPTNAYSMVIRISNGAGGDLVFRAIAATNNTSGVRFGLWNSNRDAVAYINNSATSVFPFMSSGVLAIAGLQGYRNGMPEGSPTSGIVGNTDAIEIGRPAIDSFYFLGNIAAVAICSSTQSAAQIAAVSAAMAAL